MCRYRIRLNLIIWVLSATLLAALVVLHDSYLVSLGEEEGFLQRVQAYGWGIITLWIIIFAAGGETLRSILSRPVHNLIDALKLMTIEGKTVIAHNSAIWELQEIVNVVNSLISRTEHSRNESTVVGLLQEVDIARSIAQATDSESGVKLLALAERLQTLAVALNHQELGGAGPAQ